MDNKIKLNYIKCPNCQNILDLSFVKSVCPNPLCGFNFNDLEALLDQDEGKLRQALINATKSKDVHGIKLLATAVKFNMPGYLTHFIECSWGAHYQTLFKDFITLYLDDLNVLKMILSSDVICPAKNNVVTSKNGYKIFLGLYQYLMKVHSPDIRNFLRLEFPGFYRKWYKEILAKNHRPKTTDKNINQTALI